MEPRLLRPVTSLSQHCHIGARMRKLALLALPLTFPLALAACGTGPTAPANDSATNATEAAPPSAEALAAKAQVARYFTLIAARKFDAAHRLWADDSATRTSPADLEREYARYKRYDVTPGDPTAITTQGPMAYIIVAATAKVEAVRGGPARTLNGQVNLKRPAKGGEWRIWAVDIRRPD